MRLQCRSQQDISGRPPMYPNSRVNKQTSTGSYRRSYSGSVNDVMGFERSSLNDVRGGGRGYERSRTNQDVSFDQQQQFSTPIIRLIFKNRFFSHYSDHSRKWEETMAQCEFFSPNFDYR